MRRKAYSEPANLVFKRDPLDAFRGLCLALCILSTSVAPQNNNFTTERTDIIATVSTFQPTLNTGSTPSIPNAQEKLKIGLLFVKDVVALETSIGYRRSAGAVLLAQDEIRRNHLLDGYEFEYVIRFDECEESTALGLLVDMITMENVDVIIGPTCNSPAIASAVLTSFYDLPLYVWGLTSSSDLADVARFPTTIILSPNYFHLSLAVLNMMQYFGWTEFAFAYTANSNAESCPFFNDDLQTALASERSIDLNINHQFRDATMDDFKSGLSLIRTKARIILVCLPEGNGYRRNFMLAAYDSGMTTEEYVYIFADINSRGYNVLDGSGKQKTVWASDPSDGRDSDAAMAFKRTLMISDILTETTSDTYAEFAKDVIERMADPPFNCIEDCSDPEDKVAASLSVYLYNSLIIYANALNRTIDMMGPDVRNGSALLLNAAGTYKGVMSNLTIAENGGMVPSFSMAGLDGKSDIVLLGDIVVFPNNSGVEFNWLFQRESDVFINYATGKPPSTPDCGYSNQYCPESFIVTYLGWFITIIAVVVIAILAALVAVILTARARMRENERLNMMWKIPYQMLTKIKLRSNANSSMSLQSSNSDHSVFTGNNSVESKVSTDKNQAYFYYEKEAVMGIIHNAVARLEKDDFLEMRRMRQLENENVNRFIGLSIDGPSYISIWRFCQRGSLHEVITKGNLPIDAFFIHALLMDIVSGLHFLHNSFLHFHGNLSSKTCLIDDRWQVKLSQFGLTSVRKATEKKADDLLWTAPELLRMDNMLGTEEGDIYSFAIIASELICKSSPWNLENRSETAEEVVHMVRKSLRPPFRPDLDLGKEVDISPTMLMLIKDCWSDDQRQRPDVTQLRKLMRAVYSGKKINLMDHVMNALEEYAGNLEKEVEERMRELVEEKKKSDLLLYRMLPRQVAEKLKMGQNVEPEGYQLVTIFFSDVVGFTTIAARCTPLQVVSLLNSLYTTFDATIEQHDVYKVETIGDAYLCVSGLPKRNGNEHVKEIADLSLDLLEALKSFTIVHLNHERVRIRVGAHSGPCVAGVVGLTMPRYCLFGDTVNTASRMESNGKPSQIHLSADCHNFLTQVYPGQYETEPRGEVLIKGKGVMETFWLHGRSGQTRQTEIHD